MSRKTDAVWGPPTLEDVFGLWGIIAVLLAVAVKEFDLGAQLELGARLLVLGAVATFWPWFFVILSMWSGRITKEKGTAVGLPFGTAYAGATFLIAYLAERAPKASSAVLFAAIAMLVMLFSLKNIGKEIRITRWSWIAAAGCAGVASLENLSRPGEVIGWVTLLYGVYGLVMHVVARAWLRPETPSSGESST